MKIKLARGRTGHIHGRIGRHGRDGGARAWIASSRGRRSASEQVRARRRRGKEGLCRGGGVREEEGWWRGGVVREAGPAEGRESSGQGGLLEGERSVGGVGTGRGGTTGRRAGKGAASRGGPPEGCGGVRHRGGGLAHGSGRWEGHDWLGEEEERGRQPPPVLRPALASARRPPPGLRGRTASYRAAPCPATRCYGVARCRGTMPSSCAPVPPSAWPLEDEVRGMDKEREEEGRDKRGGIHGEEVRANGRA